MKKILVTVVLGVAATAAARSATQPAQQPSQPAAQASPGQAPAAAAQAPVIKDPAEYNAYVGAIQQKDPAAQISGLEAFMAQYPNSVMKVAALQTLMQDYQQTGNQQKTIDTATKLVAADPNNVRAMALLAYFDRLKAQGNDPNAKQDLADAKKYGQMGLDALPKFTKPEGTSDADFQKMKDQMAGIFNAAVGLADLTDKDYDDARKDLRAAVDGSPDFQKDFSVVYPLAMAYAGPTPPDPKIPPDSLNAIWFALLALLALAPPQYQQQIEKYARSRSTSNTTAETMAGPMFWRKRKQIRPSPRISPSSPLPRLPNKRTIWSSLRRRTKWTLPPGSSFFPTEPRKTRTQFGMPSKASQFK